MARANRPAKTGKDVRNLYMGTGTRVNMLNQGADQIAARKAKEMATKRAAEQNAASVKAVSQEMVRGVPSALNVIKGLRSEHSARLRRESPVRQHLQNIEKNIQLHSKKGQGALLAKDFVQLRELSIGLGGIGYSSPFTKVADRAQDITGNKTVMTKLKKTPIKPAVRLNEYNPMWSAQQKEEFFRSQGGKRSAPKETPKKRGIIESLVDMVR